MGALGFASCHSNKNLSKPNNEEEPVEIKEREEMRLMYGVPTMNYQVKGQIKNANGKPVKDIRVNMLERNMDIEGTTLQGDPEAIDKWLRGTEVVTDKKGRFEISNSGLPQEQVRLLIRDVDGKANGEYRDQVVEMDVQYSDMDRTNANGWNQGTFKKEVKVKLETK